MAFRICCRRRNGSKGIEYQVLKNIFGIFFTRLILKLPSTEHRAPSTEHRAPSTEHHAQDSYLPFHRFCKNSLIAFSRGFCPGL
ncbi:hypothetical protein FGM00_13540 [Aggregatimonas sangjinii]|uniref:Uncharacterized protein n=1 Tax=Aggregatimonas sangjinii TaxID=2583587 RepID=A0A5B7SVP9_9FLAO|nr:hypothetical protein FGM00_13540 [Aggregatimonas sangjinii]